MAESRERVPPVSEDPETTNVTWSSSRFGLCTAICFATSPVFIRHGLERLPSPLLGVSVGMIITVVVYGVVLIFRRKHIQRGPIPPDAWLFQLAAGAIVGLATWARWIALDIAPLAVVITLGQTTVPVVRFLAPLLVGCKAERVTAKVWFGAVLIVVGAMILNLYS
jgi:uncharacterized membrane protein